MASPENVVPKASPRAPSLVDKYGDNVMLLVGTVLFFWGFLWRGMNITLIGLGAIVIVLEILWTARREV
jgi:hypothetical protein